MSVTQKQIEALRAAIKKDTAQALKARKNQEAVNELQIREKELVDIKAGLLEQLKDVEKELSGIQKKIVERISRKFDFSDPMMMRAARATLRKLTKQNK